MATASKNKQTNKKQILPAPLKLIKTEVYKQHVGVLTTSWLFLVLRPFQLPAIQLWNVLLNTIL